MFANTRTWVVEWGDCDAAGIVFYPRFFAAFDTATSWMIEAACERRQPDIIREHAIIGWPMVETGARFLAPASYGDRVEIESRITRLGRSSFDVAHRLVREGQVCVEATEVRVWAAPRPDCAGIHGVPIPETVAARLRAERSDGLSRP